MNEAKPPKLSEETIDRLLAAQAKEQELKARELDVRRLEVDFKAGYAHKVLEAQVANNADARNHEHREHRIRLIFGGVSLFGMLVFLGFTVWRGFTQEAMELAKFAFGAILGAFGGYGYRMMQDKEKPQNKD